ncbi:MAG TPA: tyrosine-protein phosphatase [Gemmataceae bacterium]|nr:tyrosine-protein phosphatase [Gemmataceae bacterium]
MLRFAFAAAIGLAVVLMPVAYSKKREKSFGNFRVVQEGVLYRSAQPTADGLGRAIHDYGFRTVISFRDARDDRPDEGVPEAWEGPYCAKLGVKFLRLPVRVWSYQNGVIPADGNVTKFLDVMNDPANYPVLIHCFRGIHRTGIFSAIYRMEWDGWSNAEAIAEMRDRGYDTIDRDHDVRQYLETYRPRRAGRSEQ